MSSVPTSAFSNSDNHRAVRLAAGAGVWKVERSMDIWESVVRMVSALGVVLALMLGLLALVKSNLGRRFLPVAGDPLVHILGSGSLGSRKHVLVVAVAGEVLILGTTASDLVPLGKVTDPEQVKRLLEAQSKNAVRPVESAGHESREEALHAGL
jgi:flagellar protein FliO/FliZ